LEKDRELRFRDVGELSLALRDFGGADAVVAAARVERIFGRTEPPVAAFVSDVDEATHEAAPSSPASNRIPGVPRRGHGLRVSVSLVIFAASVLALFGARRALLSPSPDATSVEPARAAAAPPVTLASSEPLAPPSAPASSERAARSQKRGARPSALPTPSPQPALLASPPPRAPGALTLIPPTPAPLVSTQPEPASTSAPSSATAQPPAPAPSETSGAVYPTPQPLPDLPPPPSN
jgi:hypothetical protein